MRFSIITPVYNRPQEVEELLESLVHQRFRDFEIVLVEDGSTEPSKHIVDRFKNRVQVQYHFRQKEGPSPARNYGFMVAKGEYLILFDSDLLVPPDYFDEVEKALAAHQWDAFGGPDRAHESFSDLQKAVNYAMTSMLTTGGIRGNKKHVGQFVPRSFNLGLSKEVYQKVGGFIDMHPGEDIDFSLRIIKEGFKVGLIPDAYVYHKRRATWRKFWRQVYKFGQKRVELSRMHPGQLKATHFFPIVYVAGTLAIPILSLFEPLLGAGLTAPWLLYHFAILVDSGMQSKSLKVGFLSVWATMIQMTSYAFGLLSGFSEDGRKAK